MSRPRDLADVLRHDMCVGCGACVAADPSLNLRLHPQKLMYEPDGVGGPDAAAVCPALQVDFTELHERLFPGEQPTALGVVEAVYLAQSVDRKRNLAASSGGIIKELMHAFLARPDVSGVIALRHHEGLRYAPALITAPEAIDRLPGSIYHSVDFSNALGLLRQHEGCFVLVAIPCQLEGIYQYILHSHPELLARIHSTVGLICGWTYTHHALKAISQFHRVPFDRLTDVAYRGGGPVGALRLFTSDGEFRVNRRVNFNYQVAFDRSFNLTRCHLCVNHTNFLADIVVGDAWLPSTVRTRTGISLVVCRRPESRAAIDQLTEQGRIRSLQVTTEEVVESQTRRVAYGDFAYAYAEYRRGLGLLAPQMQGPNRGEARLSPTTDVERFHAATERKVALQRQSRYRLLWLRKATVEAWPLAYRYLHWFAVRVVKVKSLFGARRELSRQSLSGFR